MGRDAIVPAPFVFSDVGEQIDPSAYLQRSLMGIRIVIWAHCDQAKSTGVNILLAQAHGKLYVPERLNTRWFS